MKTITKDPVCGMNVSEHQAAAKSLYRGKTYYFCSTACKEQFDKDQGHYLSEKPAESGAGRKKS